MRVKDLIAALERFNPEYQVAASSGDEYLWEVGEPNAIVVAGDNLVILGRDDGLWTAPIHDQDGNLISAGKRGYV